MTFSLEEPGRGGRKKRAADHRQALVIVIDRQPPASPSIGDRLDGLDGAQPLRPSPQLPLKVDRILDPMAGVYLRLIDQIHHSGINRIAAHGIGQV